MPDCGQEFTEEGFHLMCPKCRKMIQREKERLDAAWKAREDSHAKGYGYEQFPMDWWLPQ